ncbi:MAG: DUF92 domain-containing protein [Acidobacteria bacterium]|nr:DUF92 domain-containing protein [Acidobacteriota bacterium]
MKCLESEIAISGSLLTGSKAAVAALVTLIFSALAYRVKAVTRSGAAAGAIVSFAIYVSAGVGAFAALVSLFLIAITTTRAGYSRKQQRGTAESSQGRSASQIVANVGIAALATVLFAITQHSIFLVAAAAALAEAAADTASSEIGEATSGQARLITSFEVVPAGTDGGITLWGTLAGAMASLLIAGCCLVLQLISRSSFFLVSIAGILGMLLDSILGAVLERRQVLNNDMVNLLGTSTAALIALVLHHLCL